MKASEIFKEFGEECRWLTKDYDDAFRLWDNLPYQTIIDNIRNRGWWAVDQMGNMGVRIDVVGVDEFEELDWKDCIICRDDVEQTFTTKDMVEFVKWTNVIYRDLSHTLVIKDVDDVNELLELFKQTR